MPLPTPAGRCAGVLRTLRRHAVQVNARRWAACKRSSGVKSVATLHLMVGLPCSGKTTLAQKLEHERSALRLTPDEWQVGLFGQDAEEPEHDARHSLIEAMLWNVASRALELGTNVILDFGFWAREEREDYRLRAKRLGASSEVHFLDVPEEELLRRLAVRNSQPSQESFQISEESMKPWIEFFQRPTPEELERRE
jgi:predicted kinase